MKTSDNNKKLTPLEELRSEKAKLKEQCSEKEKHLTSRFSYVYNNLGSLLVATLVGNVGRKIGLFLPKKQGKAEFEDDDSAHASSSIRETVVNGLKLTYPIIKPVVFGFVMDKLKGIIMPKKKK